MGRPKRTCIVCRETAGKDGLMRFVLSPEGKLAADVGSKLPGRGAYVCMTNKCLDAAASKGHFSRAFRREAEAVDGQRLKELAAAGLNAYVFSLLRALAGAGILSGGTGRSEEFVKTGRASLVLIPTDASEDTVRSLLSLCTDQGVEVLRFGSKIEIAEKLGCAVRAAYCITDDKSAEKIRQATNTVRNLKVS